MTDVLTIGDISKRFPPNVVALDSASVVGIVAVGLNFIALCLIAGLVLRLTVFGETVYATGGNPEAARLSGLPTAAQGLELDAIAAVVAGTFFAVMLLQVLRRIFNLLGLGSFYQMTLTGVIIIAAILLNRFIDIRRGRG